MVPVRRFGAQMKQNAGYKESVDPRTGFGTVAFPPLRATTTVCGLGVSPTAVPVGNTGTMRMTTMLGTVGLVAHQSIVAE